jgi:hypothetical protein
MNAGLIDLVGHSSLQGFGEVNLASQGDMRMRGVVFDDFVTSEVEYAYTGSLATGGNLNLAARQIYPVSMAEFALEVHNNPTGRINVTSIGADSAVLSAGGRLSLSAPFIGQGGTIKAPFGEILLKSEAITRTTTHFQSNGLPSSTNKVSADAIGGEVNLAAGSLTSVSAEGQTIPLGATELSGSDWVYDFGLFKQVLASAPEKQIVLDGDSVTVATGARIDLSGGGDIYAYEFLSGPGGSKDILTAENSAGLYAVLPDLGSHFAAYDYQTYQGLENWNPGASVQLLEGANGLAAGNYALLPARYALLPGAYLVRVSESDSNQYPGYWRCPCGGLPWQRHGEWWCAARRAHLDTGNPPWQRRSQVQRIYRYLRQYGIRQSGRRAIAGRCRALVDRRRPEPEFARRVAGGLCQRPARPGGGYFRRQPGGDRNRGELRRWLRQLERGATRQSGCRQPVARRFTQHRCGCRSGGGHAAQSSPTMPIMCCLRRN